MSYSIFIGEAEVESDTDDEFYCRWSVKNNEHKDAPSFKGDEFTGKTNGRHSGYSQWGKFCKKVGLYDFFFNEDKGLMRNHPGCFHLEKQHLDTLKSCLDSLEIIDDRPPGLDERYIKDECADIPEGEEKTSYNKVRLIWLIWWVDWALNNCKHPAISNS